jgi:hypothetical protein
MGELRKLVGQSRRRIREAHAHPIPDSVHDLGLHRRKSERALEHECELQRLAALQPVVRVVQRGTTHREIEQAKVILDLPGSPDPLARKTEAGPPSMLLHGWLPPGYLS